LNAGGQNVEFSTGNSAARLGLTAYNVKLVFFIICLAIIQNVISVKPGRIHSEKWSSVLTVGRRELVLMSKCHLVSKLFLLSLFLSPAVLEQRM
jgi:hypothetical protein